MTDAEQTKAIEQQLRAALQDELTHGHLPGYAVSPDQLASEALLPTQLDRRPAWVNCPECGCGPGFDHKHGCTRARQKPRRIR